MYYLVSEERGERKGEKKSESKKNVSKKDGGIMSNEELEELKKKNERLIASYNDVVRKYNTLLDEYNKVKSMADANLY